MGKVKDHGKMVMDNWDDVEKLKKIRSSLRNIHTKDKTNGTSNFTEEKAEAFKNATLRIKELGKGEKLSLYPKGYIPPSNPIFHEVDKRKSETTFSVSPTSPVEENISPLKDEIVVETQEEMAQKMKIMIKSHKKQLLKVEKKYQEKIEAIEEKQREQLLIKYREWDAEMEKQLLIKEEEYNEVLQKQRRKIAALDKEWFKRMEILEKKYNEEMLAREKVWMEEIEAVRKEMISIVNKQLMTQKIKGKK